MGFVTIFCLVRKMVNRMSMPLGLTRMLLIRGKKSFLKRQKEGDQVLGRILKQ